MPRSLELPCPRDRRLGETASRIERGGIAESGNDRWVNPRKYMKWSRDHLSATCMLCMKTLSTSIGSLSTFRRHLRRVHRAKVAGDASYTPTEGRLFTLKPRGSEEENRYEPRLEDWDFAEENGISNGRDESCSTTLTSVSCATGNMEAEKSSCKRPFSIQICRSGYANDNGTLRTPEAKFSRNDKALSSNRARQITQEGVANYGTNAVPLAEGGPSKLTDEELAAACSVQWKLHGIRSRDGKYITCKWCEAKYRIHEKSLLHEFVKHLAKWHKIEYVNGRKNVALDPDRNLAVQGYYLLCDICFAAIFVNVASLEKHLEECHRVS